MAPVRNVTIARPTKEAEILKSRQQSQMQQQPHKRSHKSTLRYRITTGSGGGGCASGTTTNSSNFCGRRLLNGNNDYTVSTNQQPSGTSTVETPKTAVTVTGETVFASGNNRKFSKSNNTYNNPTTTTTEARRKRRQYSPEEESTETNVVVCGTQLDIDQNPSKFSEVFNTPNNAKTAPKSSVCAANEDKITERTLPRIQKELNKSSTPTASSSVVKLTKAYNNPLLPINLLKLATSLTPAQIPVIPATATTVAANSTQTTFCGGGANVESILLQRLQLIKHFLSVTAPTVRGLNQRLRTQNEEVPALMVYENRPENMDRDVVVNSASLEDVALSELSENRAQSIQSLHSVETPTPDTTPSFEELQQRLETSNRNIQNMQEQQQQLLRLQNAAKQHLSEMEHLRQQAGTLSFGANQANAANNGDGAPEYESIDQVHSDMATLVGRMKNLTTFIQNQNELSNLLGDDGPEILAEQEALQRKLESLRAQRDDMRTLVSELQEINRTAERRIGTEPNENTQTAAGNQPTAGAVKAQVREESPQATAARVVPVTYTRNVPIKLTNGSVPLPTENISADHDNDDSSEKAATAMLIQQKVADIETMRKQLQRLKDMMETVNMIEARTSRNVNDIGRTPPREVRSLSRTTGSSGASFDRECTPVSVVPAHYSSAAEAPDDNSYLTRKMRMINEVTSDLRAQAESLQAERDRIKALKDEIVLRKQQAAAAAQLGEDALKRSSLTPTPTPRSRKQRELDTPSPPPLTSNENERDQLKMEYEAKKREFELLCQRLQQDDNTTQSQPTSTKVPPCRDTVSEADDEADGDEELIDSDFATTNAASTARQYFAAPQQQSTPAQQHRAAVKAAVTAHTQATGVASAKVNVQHRQSQGQRLPVGALGKEESFETNQTSSTAGERRHSTLANATTTTQDGASFEAGSVQSGSSQSAFSMPPPMAAMGPCSSWPPLPPMPNTWNPQFYYGFGAAAPPHQPTSSQPNSATTTQNAGAPFTPVGLLPQPTVNSECICSAANSATTAQIVTGPTPTSSSTNTAAQLAADPVLLQQFVQTQQMLINSVCQCNQMLWHQQREIDALNNTIHVLQDRLLALSGGVNAVPLAADIPYTIRAESVPPPSLTAGTLPNNLYLNNSNRAQSEQPALFLPGITTAARNSAFSNYQHHQQQQYQQRQQRGHISAAAGGVTATNSYNFSSESQQHSNIASASSANAGLYSTLNNAAPPPPPLSNQASQSHYNNEVPQSPPLQGNAAGPGPIFMHHHNNAIHQNNANLRTQNHYANNLHQQQQQQQPHGHSNINVGGGNTLNNQVPPGNRANNYWDNFRSYSRQNLLSTNSNKSNEEQQQQNQLQQQQHQHQHYVQQRLLEQLDTPAPSHYRAQQQPHHRSTTALPTAAALTTSNLQQLQRQQQEEAAQQQQRSAQTQPQLYRSLGDNNSNNCNNLNFERNANHNKYLRTLQRSHINRYQQQQQQQQQQNLALINSLYTNHSNLYQSWLPTANNDENNVEMDVYDAYNIVDSDLATPYAHLSSNICANSSNMLRNMNVNFGNSPHYQRNKLLTKPNCRGTAAEAIEEQHNPNRGQQSQQQQQIQQRILSQQQLALRTQLQLEQSTLRSMRNVPGYTQTRYLDLLPATVSEAVASAQAQLRNRDRVDMLLRTVTAGDDEDERALAAAAASGGGNNTNYSSTYIPNANETLLMESNEIGNNTPNIDNETADEPDGDATVLTADADVAHDEEEDDDTTSEEIKRNLLVNALKNDKFTTKFYESIKEDVFRRLERMLLEKESAETNCQRGPEQIINGLTAKNGDPNNTNAMIDGPNDTQGAASLQRDPTRKFNLNARIGNQQHQQRLHQLQQHNQQHNFFPPLANAYEIKQEGTKNYHAAEDDQHVLTSAEGKTQAENFREAGTGDNAEEDEYSVNNADTESNKADNEDAAAAAASAVVIHVNESEQPEEDNLRYNDNSKNVVADEDTTARQAQPPTSAQQKQLFGAAGKERDESNITNWLQNVLSQAESNAANISTSNIGKKRKNQLEAANRSGAGGDAETMPFSISTNNSVQNNLRQTYYTDLIAYIITRIRNQTHPNTQINDTILVEIAKLTASAVQNFAPTLGNYKSLFTSPPHISPKKFYMKIKKLSVPRQRDEFLQWYENYLENLFPGARWEAERRREELRNSGNAGAVPFGLELPHISNKLENHQQQRQLHQPQLQKQQARNASNSDHKDNNDADLAEADQNSANSSSNTTIEERQNQQHENELENNENPDDNVGGVGVSTLPKYAEQDDVGAVGGAYAIMPSLAGGAAAAASVTEDVISAALQQHDLLRYATDTIADGGSPAEEFTPHNGYT